MFLLITRCVRILSCSRLELDVETISSLISWICQLPRRTRYPAISCSWLRQLRRLSASQVNALPQLRFALNSRPRQRISSLRLGTRLQARFASASMTSSPLTLKLQTPSSSSAPSARSSQR
ncbi:Hypothetical_protein [Hexamita inflata]|uniref:Hypothetical_protein n=1 Tax=Hexamita inflata TaxID=28002 RepID=A0AA86R428_9EUKA|nr:Hypothetical protein HINF_LOCUS57740 [Hexamita inflata]